MNITAINANSHPKSWKAQSRIEIWLKYVPTAGAAKTPENRKKAAATTNQLNPFSDLCLTFAYSANATARRRATPSPKVPSNRAITISPKKNFHWTEYKDFFWTLNITIKE